MVILNRVVWSDMVKYTCIYSITFMKKKLGATRICEIII